MALITQQEVESLRSMLRRARGDLQGQLDQQGLDLRSSQAIEIVLTLPTGTSASTFARDIGNLEMSLRRILGALVLIRGEETSFERPWTSALLDAWSRGRPRPLRPRVLLVVSVAEGSLSVRLVVWTVFDVALTLLDVLTAVGVIHSQRQSVDETAAAWEDLRSAQVHELQLPSDAPAIAAMDDFVPTGGAPLVVVTADGERHLFVFGSSTTNGDSGSPEA